MQSIHAHAHAMIFGWVGLFVMGFAYQSFPRLLLDYTSNYPASAALLNTWRLEIAKKIKVKNITQDAA